MQIKFLDLNANYSSIKDEINLEINKVLDNSDYIQGRKVGEFENNFANYLGINHFIGCANGTDALEIAIQSLDLPNDSEILIQGNTYIATCLGALNNNLSVVLCDINKDTYMLCLDDARKKFTLKTKVLIVVHLYGLVPNMDEIVEFCNENNIILIEDCAQAHGAKWKSVRVGSFGKLSCFSFYPGKNLGAYGDGGGIGTNDNELNLKIRKIANLGCVKKYYHEIIGRNSRLDTLQAAVLDVKLKHLDNWNELRRKNAKIYYEHLSHNSNIELPISHNNSEPVYHLFVIKTKYRNRLKQYLEDHKISTLIHYPISICETDAMKHIVCKTINCIDISNQILSLPMYPELTNNEIMHICDKINNFFLEDNLLKLTPIETDGKPGTLHYINNMNFETKRLFYLDNFSDLNNSKRGSHANVNFDEFITVINGSVEITITDKNGKILTKTLTKDDAFLVPKLNWIEYKIIDTTTTLLVLANEILSKSIRIFDFKQFLITGLN